MAIRQSRLSYKGIASGLPETIANKLNEYDVTSIIDSGETSIFSSY